MCHKVFDTVKNSSLWQCHKLCDTLCDTRNYFFISNQLLSRLDNHVERCRTPGVAEKWRPRLFRTRRSRRDLSSGDEMQWRQTPGWSDGEKRESLPTQVLVPCLLQRRVLRRGTVVKEGTIGGHLRIQRSAKYPSSIKPRILVIYFHFQVWMTRRSKNTTLRVDWLQLSSSHFSSVGFTFQTLAKNSSLCPRSGSIFHDRTCTAHNSPYFLVWV